MRPRIGLGKCSHIQSIIPNSDLASTRSPQKVIRRGCPFFSGCPFIILRRYRIVWGHSTAQLRAVWNLLTTFSCRTCVRASSRNIEIRGPNSQGNPGLRPGMNLPTQCLWTHSPPWIFRELLQLGRSGASSKSGTV